MPEPSQRIIMIIMCSGVRGTGLSVSMNKFISALLGMNCYQDIASEVIFPVIPARQLIALGLPLSWGHIDEQPKKQKRKNKHYF